MKSNSKKQLALSYANALYEAAAAEQAVPAVLADVMQLKAAMQQDAAIAAMLANPLWHANDKIQATAAVGEKLGFNRLTVNCLQIAAENERLAKLPEILDAFVKVYYAAENIAEVYISTAIELSVSQDTRLRAALEKWLNKKVVVNYVIKPDVLGGLLVECGSKMLDDSLKGKLGRLELLMKGTE